MLIARAEQRLRAGRVEEAQTSIGDALAAAPFSSDAKALSSIISLVRNDKAEALRLAREAVEATANSAPAWLALSYAQQADFKLEAALTSAQRAAELTPSSALALARVAELQLSLGWTREAEKTAQQAVAANPSESRAHMILGFVHLAQINVKEAREDFERAIEIDSTDPLSRLGLGLAIIRKGKLVEGREQIEIAVALDPTNSLIRSYVGKAYYEENTKERDKLASTQFGLAKQLDPKDPTPWFYDAILGQKQNDSIAAIEGLQKSKDLNENRAVYRSRLLLDEDQAARSANLAPIYQDAGFDQLALSEAYRSLVTDPQSYAAHKFLAGAYEGSPRLEMARESEQLQASLRAPIGVIPVSPFRGFQPPFAIGLPRPFVVPSVAPARASYNNYEPLFEQSGVNLFADGTLATQDTSAGQAIVAAANDNLAMSFGYGQFRTDGFDVNHGLSQQGGNLFANVRASDRLHLQLEATALQSDYGIVRFGFDPILAVPQQVEDDSNALRLSGRYQVNMQSALLFSG